MNGSFFSNPTFPGSTKTPMTPPGNISSQSTLPLEQSLIEIF